MTIEEILLGNKPKKVDKVCPQCSELLPITEFRKSTKDNYQSYCNNCSNLKQYNYRKTEKGKLIGKRSDRKIRINSRKAVLEGYSNRCNCCGETHSDFLQIDHINNDGAEERKRLFGRNKGTPATFYKMLIKLGFPKDRYQLLCANCNHAKQKFGRCNCQDIEPILIDKVDDYICL